MSVNFETYAFYFLDHVFVDFAGADLGGILWSPGFTLFYIYIIFFLSVYLFWVFFKLLFTWWRGGVTMDTPPLHLMAWWRNYGYATKCTQCFKWNTLRERPITLSFVIFSRLPEAWVNKAYVTEKYFSKQTITNSQNNCPNNLVQRIGGRIIVARPTPTNQILV